MEKVHHAFQGILDPQLSVISLRTPFKALSNTRVCWWRMSRDVEFGIFESTMPAYLAGGNRSTFEKSRSSVRERGDYARKLFPPPRRVEYELTWT